ncbi:hypothetical protein B0H12DRAFT_459203 [Mycena haematopus]|nr:hypothetical protein B0H12DRAFT_459203 [Mycena haematopus]
MVILHFQISLEVLGLFLVVLCALAQYLKRRVVFHRHRQSARQPILGVLQAPNQLADTHHFAPLYPPLASPVIVNRRQFSAPASPNLQLLPPKQRRTPQRRPPYEYPLSASLPTTPFRSSTPVCPFPAPSGSRRVDSPPSSTFHENAECTTRLLAGPSPASRSRLVPSPGPLSSPVAQPGSDSPASLFVERRYPPRSPLAPTPGSDVAQTSPFAQLDSPAGLFVERRPHDLRLTSPHLTIDPVLPSPELSHQQTIPSGASRQPIVSTSHLLPSPIPADRLAAPSPPQQRTVRQAPHARPPSPMPESIIASTSRKTSKKMNRHSMVFRRSPSHTPSRSRAVSADVPDLKPPALSSASPSHSEKESQIDSNASGLACAAKAANIEIVEERLPLVDMHNTPPPAAIVKDVVVELHDGLVRASRRRSPQHAFLFTPFRIPAYPNGPGPSPLVAALFSPTKVPRRFVDHGPSPVYHYRPDTPAAVVGRSTVRLAQNDFMNFSSTLGARFEQKGWAAAGPNELAAVKKGKKKRKAHAKDVQLKPPSLPPIQFPVSNPAFEQTVDSPSPKPRARFVLDFTTPTISTACHPDCADIYCPGWCSGQV